METKRTSHTQASIAVARRTSRAGRAKNAQAGFTLIEALIATLVLVVGLIGISNLMVVAISSNSLGNRITMSAFVASQKMEQLRSIPFDNASFADSASNSLDTDVSNFNENVTVGQGGTYHTRWNIRTVTAYGASLKFIAVRTESTAPLGRLTRAEFTSFRACTLTGCAP